VCGCGSLPPFGGCLIPTARASQRTDTSACSAEEALTQGSIIVSTWWCWLRSGWAWAASPQQIGHAAHAMRGGGRGHASQGYGAKMPGMVDSWFYPGSGGTFDTAGQAELGEVEYAEATGKDRPRREGPRILNVVRPHAHNPCRKVRYGHVSSIRQHSTHMLGSHQPFEPSPVRADFVSAIHLTG
jgi:hypothetical protein